MRSTTLRLRRVGPRRAPLLPPHRLVLGGGGGGECDEAEQSAIDAVGASISAAAAAAALDVGATPSTASFFGEGPASPAEARSRATPSLVKLMLAPDPAARPSAEQIVEDVAALLRSS